jgi:hypothetical protein
VPISRPAHPARKQRARDKPSAATALIAVIRGFQGANHDDSVPHRSGSGTVRSAASIAPSSQETRNGAPARVRRSGRQPRRGPAAQGSARASARLPAAPPPETTGRPGRHGRYTLDSAAHVKPEHAAGAARPWPSVKTPSVRTDRPGGPDAVRYTSVDPATQRSTVRQDDTPRDREETARIAETSQLADRLRRWWQVLCGRCWARTNVG